MVIPKKRETAVKSITSKLAIIILSLLASTHTFAFNSEHYNPENFDSEHHALEQVCAAMNEALNSKPMYKLPIYWGPITNIHSRDSELASAGGVIGTVGGYPDRITTGVDALICGIETCQPNKKWPDCECTNSRCADDEATARRNLADPQQRKISGSVGEGSG